MFEKLGAEELFLIIVGIIDVILIVTIIIYLTKKDKSEEIKKVEEEKTTSIEQSLEAIKKDAENPKQAVISSFEQEQEEKAIISYQELLNAHDAGTNEEPVKIKIEDPIEEKEPKEEAEAQKYSYQETEFISPVFGRINSNGEAIKKVPLKPITNGIVENQKYDDFLETLKEFRNNL